MLWATIITVTYLPVKGLNLAENICRAWIKSLQVISYDKHCRFIARTP